jgi:hypothetical protein
MRFISKADEEILKKEWVGVVNETLQDEKKLKWFINLDFGGLIDFADEVTRTILKMGRE